MSTKAWKKGLCSPLQEFTLWFFYWALPTHVWCLMESWNWSISTFEFKLHQPGLCVGMLGGLQDESSTLPHPWIWSTRLATHVQVPFMCALFPSWLSSYRWSIKTYMVSLWVSRLLWRIHRTGHKFYKLTRKLKIKLYLNNSKTESIGFK